MRKPVHYAAACIGPEPLKILVAAGGNLREADKKKINCLHIAAMRGRAHNIRTILTEQPDMIKIRDKQSMTAMGYACKFGHIEAVKTLIEFNAKKNASCGKERFTPLCFAAAYGHHELTQTLLALKARVLGKDKFKRTPLILAVRNGHTKIASLLL